MDRRWRAPSLAEHGTSRVTETGGVVRRGLGVAFLLAVSCAQTQAANTAARPFNSEHSAPAAADTTVSVVTTGEPLPVTVVDSHGRCSTGMAFIGGGTFAASGDTASSTVSDFCLGATEVTANEFFT